MGGLVLRAAQQCDPSAEAEVAGLSIDEQFTKFLCAHNRSGEQQLAIEQAVRAERQAAVEAREATGVDVPMAAFAVARQLYERLSIELPDATQQAEDAAVVWAKAQELGGLDAVVEVAEQANTGADDQTLAAILGG